MFFCLRQFNRCLFVSKLNFSCRRYSSECKILVDIHPKVQQAIKRGQPIVALESTIITHGMPYPYNLETALEVEDIVLSHGAVPATIAILNGKIKVGLEQADLKELASFGPSKVTKCSRRDLPYVIANSLSGGTTVAGTIVIANMVGLKIFATGGIGGVHRQGHETLDISADLVELGRTPVTVVSSGIKSILDIPKTLEYLETQGVCVATYCSPGGKFPDFYTQDSGFSVAYNLNTPTDAANLIKSLQHLDQRSGILIGVPIPAEFAVNKSEIDAAIEKAYKEAHKQNVSGKAVTPFILSTVSKITDGNSLNANMALVKNNAKVAAQIALEYYKPTRSRKNSVNAFVERSSDPPVVIGGSILDLSLTLVDDFTTFNGATYHTKAKQSAGGVGRNLAEGLHKLIGPTKFISAVGNDQLGRSLLDLIPAPQRECIHIDPSTSTSLCSLIFDKHGDCKIILGNMDIHKNITPERILMNEKVIAAAPLIIMDANLSLPTMQCILEIALKYNKPVFFEPTDMRIAGKPFEIPRKELTQQIKIISPNIWELAEIFRAITKQPIELPPEILKNTQLITKKAKEILLKINEHFDCIIVTLGEHGVIVDRRKSDGPLFDINGCYQHNLMREAQCRSMTFFPGEKVPNMLNVSGAGDSFSSGFIAGMLNGKSTEKCVALGFFAARKALQSDSAVPKQYFENKLDQFKLLQNTDIIFQSI